MTLLRAAGLHTCLLAAVLACALTGCGGARARFASHVQRGQQFLASGNLDKASVEFRNAAQIEPKNPQALYFNGRVAEARSNIREAYAYYQAAVDADPKYMAARAGLGKMLVFGGAAQRAMDTIEPALAEHPDDVELLAVRATAHHQLKENDAARADAEHAVKLDPNNENALSVLAALYADDKDYPKAISLLSDAVNRVPNSVPLREVLTNLYLVSGDSAHAQEQMRKIIELRPLELAPRSQLALHLIRNHDLDGGQQVLEAAVRDLAKGGVQAKVDEAKLLLVDFVSRERSREQGEKTLRDFIAQDPKNLDLRLGLGALLQRSGAVDDAFKAYSDVLERDESSPKALVARDRMASIQLSKGKLSEAAELLAQVLQKNPRDGDALVMRSTLEMRQNDPTSAIADLRAALRDQPNSATLQRSLANAYLAKGQSALAEESLRAAMKVAPNDVLARIELAQVLTRTERAVQAVTLMEDTVKLLPNSLPAQEALAQAYLSVGNLEAAATSAESLKQRDPQSAAGYYYAGVVAARKKQLPDSQTNLETALKLQPQRIDVLTALAQVQTARGQSDAAIARVRTALDQNPTSLDLQNLLGGLYFDRKDFQHAAEVFARQSAANPTLWQPHRNLALVKLAANDSETAVKEFAAALQLAPTEPKLVADGARTFEKYGHVDAAIAAYEGLYKGNSSAQQFAANNLAMLLVTHKTDQASLDRARDLTSSFVQSNNGSLLDTAGWVRFKRGEYQDALTPLERALEREPESRVIRYHLGMAQLQLGLRDRARTNLESALSGTDTFQGADEARTVLASLKARA